MLIEETPEWRLTTALRLMAPEQMNFGMAKMHVELALVQLKANSLAPPTTAIPTTVPPSAVQEQESTAQKDSTSLQSDTAEAPSGPAEPSSECAHLYEYGGTTAGKEPWSVLVYCPKCHASWQFDKTPVRHAATTLSTFPKPASSESAETLPEAAVKSSSSESEKPNHHWSDPNAPHKHLPVPGWITEDNYLKYCDCGALILRGQVLVPAGYSRPGQTSSECLSCKALHKLHVGQETGKEEPLYCADRGGNMRPHIAALSRAARGEISPERAAVIDYNEEHDFDSRD